MNPNDPDQQYPYAAPQQGQPFTPQPQAQPQQPNGFTPMPMQRPAPPQGFTPMQQPTQGYQQPPQVAPPYQGAPAPQPARPGAPMPLPANLLGTLATASQTGAGDYFPCLAAEYILQCIDFKAFQSRDPQKYGKWFLAAEWMVLTSVVDSVHVGSQKSHLIDLSQTSADGNVKNLLLALLGLRNDPGDIDLGKLNEIIMSGAAKGVKVRLRTAGVKTRAGGDFTKHIYDVYAETGEPAPPDAPGGQAGAPAPQGPAPFAQPQGRAQGMPGPGPAPFTQG